MYMSRWRRQLFIMTSRFGVCLAFFLLISLLTSLFYFLCFLRCGSFYLVHFLMFSVLLFFCSFIFCASLLILLVSLIVTSAYSIYLISRLSWRHRIFIFVLVLLINFSFNIGITSASSVQYIFMFKTLHGGCLNSAFISHYVINQYIEIARHFTFIWVIWTFFLIRLCHFSYIIRASLFIIFLFNFFFLISSCYSYFSFTFVSILILINASLIHQIVSFMCLNSCHFSINLNVSFLLLSCLHLFSVLVFHSLLRWVLCVLVT